MFLGTGDQPKIVFGNVGTVNGVGGKLGGSFNGGSALEYDTMGAWSYNNSSVALWLRADGSINDSVSEEMPVQPMTILARSRAMLPIQLDLGVEGQDKPY
jgi:hypothetical protein